MSITLTNIAHIRLSAQQLLIPSYTTAHDLVSWLGAVQAQEFAQTIWGIGLRLPFRLASEIEQEFNEGRILRTHLLRPTWHFVTAEDIQWMLALTAPRVHAVNKFMYRQTELNESIFRHCNELIIQSLQGGKQLTREELNEVFKQHSIEASSHRLSYIMMYSELNGTICSGAKKGNQHTYALISERITQVPQLSIDEALLELTKRYFQSRGPATVNDFSVWSGLTLTECRKGINSLGKELISYQLEGALYYFTQQQTEISDKPTRMLLLPMYDEYVMGYKDRSAIFVNRNNLKPKPKSLHNCIIIWNGQVIGTWKRTVTSKTMNVEYQFFEKLSIEQNLAFEQALEDLENFSKLKISLK